MVKIYQLELASVCNLSCSFCPIYKPWADKDTGYMKMDLLDRIDWMDTEYTELQFGGEPTLHPKIHEIREHIQAKGIKVGMSSNGTKKNFDYSKFDIITTTKDIEREPLFSGPNVFIQELGVDHPYEDYSHSKPHIVPEVFNCSTPDEYVSIHFDGDVVPCCKCFGKQHVFGNLYDQTMLEILNSNKRKSFLDKMKKASESKQVNGLPYICRYCTSPNPHKIHSKLINWIDSRKGV